MVFGCVSQPLLLLLFLHRLLVALFVHHLLFLLYLLLLLDARLTLHRVLFHTSSPSIPHTYPRCHVGLGCGPYLHLPVIQVVPSLNTAGKVQVDLTIAVVPGQRSCLFPPLLPGLGQRSYLPLKLLAFWCRWSYLPSPISLGLETEGGI